MTGELRIVETVLAVILDLLCVACLAAAIVSVFQLSAWSVLLAFAAWACFEASELVIGDQL